VTHDLKSVAALHREPGQMTWLKDYRPGWWKISLACKICHKISG